YYALSPYLLSVLGCSLINHTLLQLFYRSTIPLSLMTLEYTMIEPCRTLLKFFEKFHHTVVQISFLGGRLKRSSHVTSKENIFPSKTLSKFHMTLKNVL